MRECSVAHLTVCRKVKKINLMKVCFWKLSYVLKYSTREYKLLSRVNFGQLIFLNIIFILRQGTVYGCCHNTREFLQYHNHCYSSQGYFYNMKFVKLTVNLKLLWSWFYNKSFASSCDSFTRKKIRNTYESLSLGSIWQVPFLSPYSDYLILYYCSQQCWCNAHILFFVI